ncbi:PAS domain-containing hybrid sensor histidine kinase/response regulator [Desulfovibrio gilichinskyi]|uniref:histidine kinase n=1 Tax=Desulfovibrio gilichinskyi TaxID=1519643 RepID=A0A1X7DME9_9BACT|nr:PAS domain-containing hybrid sensor histidine kinase/response regulator [Desulfovibrio gilichinskyi]SMF17580.1 PAS domain S-box-containing protein [Desulfovibrio gilichinskyi]
MDQDLTHGDNSPNTFQFRLIFISAVIVFATVIGYVLWTSYCSQLQVRKTARSFFIGESTKRAMAVSFFFSGRLRELNRLGSSAAMQSFISMQGSPDFNLQDQSCSSAFNNIYRAISDAVSTKYQGQDQSFSRIAVLDSKGDLLADTDSECALHRGNDSYANYAVKENGPQFSVRHSSGVFSIIIGVPCVGTGGDSGTILGWVSPDSLFESLSDITALPSVGNDFLVLGHTVLALTDNSASESGQLLLMDVLGGEWNGVTLLKAGKSGRKVDYLALSSPVKGTSLHIISLVEEQKLFGLLGPQLLLFFSILLFLVVIAGCYYLVRSTIMQQVYETDIAAAARREDAINSQRLELEREIEERKLADYLRIKAESRYRDIFDNAPVGIFQINMSGTYITANAAYASLLGYADAEELIALGTQAQNGIYYNHDDITDILNHLRVSGRVSGCEVLCVRKDGVLVWTRREFRLVSSEFGVQSYIEGFVIDITARRKAEEKLLSNQKRLSSIFENSPVALWELDFSLLKKKFDSYDDTTTANLRENALKNQEKTHECVELIKIIAANNLAVDFIGAKSREELIALGFSSYVLKKSWKYFRSILLDFVSGSLRHRSEFHFVREDGKEQFFIVNCTIAPDMEGSWGRVLATVEDISELKRIEKELRISKDEAQKANAAKGQFLANMSHEFRTPMNAIKGMVQLIQATELTAEQNENLRLIKSSVDSLLIIANDILDFSKIDSGHMELQTDVLDLPLFLKEIRDVMDIGAMNKNLEVVLKTENIPVCVEVDSMRLRQILVNLLGNAVKFTSSGKVILSAELVPDIGPGRKKKIYFEVSDTGIGLPEDGAESLFKSFVQADASITRKYGGTGLGLAICHRLIKLMGGELKGGNNPDGGAVFSFVLPVLECRVGGSNDHVEPATGDIDTSYDFSKIKVLVAEDSKMNQILLRKIFEKIELKNFVIVGNGIEAVDTFTESEDFDIVFMDIQMPIMDGFEAARAIRKLHSPVRIVALTANSDLEYWQLCQDCGMDTRITKPFNIEDLLAELKKVS